MKRYIGILLVLVGVASCNPHSAHWDTLIEVESFIEEMPDSSLSRLQRINHAELSGKEEKAKYALLLSMALDKNFIDKTDFEVLQPAIDYYDDNGTATDKLRTYYYQGRIYQNRKDDAKAIECYVNAIEARAGSDDLLTQARTYFAQSKIYYSLFEWDKFIGCNKNAARFFKEAGAHNSYANCLIRIVNGYTLKDEPDSALAYIDECKPILETVTLNRLGDFYSSYLTYLALYGSKQEVIDVIEAYTDTVPSSQLDWLTVSNAYSEIGMYDEALSALSHYDCGSDVEDQRKFQAIISDIYKKRGEYKKSLDAYDKYIALADSIDYALYTQDTKFVEERYQLEVQALKERASKNRVFLIASLFILALLTVIVWSYGRLKMSRIQKALAEKEIEKYQMMYLQMEEERDELTNLLSQEEELGPDIKTAIGQRLELLNKFFTAYITNNSEIDRKANKEMEELLTNKDTFMKSTKLAFAGSHPKFIKYLEDRGLTEWEINYCCLYALGLKGKEVGTYIKMRSHYNHSSEVREKLGINEHETNLGIYIRKLLKSFE